MATMPHMPDDSGHAAALATAFGHGSDSGCTAASADRPTFLADQALILVAWEMSCAGTCAQPPTMQEGCQEQDCREDCREEYFIGWVHGYVMRAEQLEGAFLSSDVVVDR
ncbi:MAG TPA: hypothetical protein VGR57_19865 [Ktedonobacterales bacterium]|nr:hypothetical protein [Ktedonobacterales bacterium]